MRPNTLFTRCGRTRNEKPWEQIRMAKTVKDPPNLSSHQRAPHFASVLAMTGLKRARCCHPSCDFGSPKNRPANGRPLFVICHQGAEKTQEVVPIRYPLVNLPVHKAAKKLVDARTARSDLTWIRLPRHGQFPNMREDINAELIVDVRQVNQHPILANQTVFTAPEVQTAPARYRI